MSHNGNYTPTLDVIASHYCNDRSADNYQERMAYEAKRRVEFDRAIAKIRAEAKAEAWEEGWGTGWADAWDNAKSTSNKVTTSTNPYRADKMVTE